MNRKRPRKLIGRIAWLMSRVQGERTENVGGGEQKSRAAPVIAIAEREGPTAALHNL
jgi:hypothetical protein